MNPSPSKPRFGRPMIAVGTALAAAALMILAAWIKSSTAPGSVAEEVLEGTILLLMIVALFVPYLALPIGRGKNGARQS